MIEFDEDGYYTDENGNHQIHPFMAEHASNPIYDAIRSLWAKTHPEEMGAVAPSGD